MSATHRLVRWTGIFGLALSLQIGTAWAEGMKPAHYNLKSSRGQANREQIFKHLMTKGQYTPTWMQGKPQAQVRAWSQRMQKVIQRNSRKVVEKIVADPSANPSAREQKILGLLSPFQRAQLLKDVAGFTVKKVKYKVDGVPTDKLKIVLKRHGHTNYYGTAPAEFTKQMQIYHRVMSPNLVTFAPAGGHSKYVSQGKMFDIWSSGGGYGDLRPNNYPHFPTWLSDGEAKRMKQVADLGSNWNSYSSGSHALGGKFSHGIAGMWPPTKNQRKKPSNSCTTTFIRAPVGERDPAFAWIDKLQGKVTQAAKSGRASVDGFDLKKTQLLEAITGKTKAEYQAVFAKLKQQMPGEARNLTKLQGEVDFFFDKLKHDSGSSYSYYNRNNAPSDPKCHFPMNLIYRAPLSKLANIKGDPLGPGMAKQKFRAGDPTRLGVVTVFEKERR